MADIRIINITHDEFVNKNYLRYKDKYSLNSFINEDLRATILQCPTKCDNHKTTLLLTLDGDIVVARMLLFGTKIKVDNSFVISQSMGSIEVCKEYRGRGIGSRMRDYCLYNDEYPFYLFSLLSPSFLSIMRKKEKSCTIFDFPEYVKVINSEAAFACRGFVGLPLNVLKTLTNALIKTLDVPNKIRLKYLKRYYTINQLHDVPEWAGKMCLNDGHKYAEYHDTKWLQWCLDHNLSGHREDIQKFYAIYDRGNRPIGFFLTKERRRLDITNCRMINGTVCEWATIDDNLSEADINLLSLETFSKDCYRVLTVTNNKRTEKKLRHYGFIKHGYMQMGFRDKSSEFSDINDINLWRIRFGCCNSILY